MNKEQLTEALALTGVAEFMNQEDTLPKHVQIVREAAREHLACGTVTDQMVEAARRLFADGKELHWVVQACGWTRDGPKLSVDALIRLVLEAALRVEGT